MTEKTKTYPPFGFKDKIGYMFGDLANDMTFILQSSFLMIFYTEIWGIPGSAVGTLFLVSRIVDAFTDTIMGRIVDTVPTKEEGKFKPWIKRFAIPVALASFLMYQVWLKDMSMTFKMVYMYITYLLWGSICYTAINIPYGSMASAITSNPDERTELSAWRSRGATIAGIIIGAVVPMIVYQDVNGQQVIKTDNTFTVMAGIFSIVAVIFYFICYNNTHERISIPSSESKSGKETMKVYGNVLKNRSLIGIFLASLCMIMSQLMIGAMNNYLFKDFYNNSRGLSLVGGLNPLLTLLLSSTIGPMLSKKYGKREVGSISTLLGGIIYILLFFMRTENMWVYIVLSATSYTCMGIFNTIIWATIIDVIDDVEVKEGQREDGTIYGLYSFARKVGQAIAGAASGWALSGIGYISGQAVQDASVINGIYNIATLVPGIGLIACALVLIFIYPLSKARVDENSRILHERNK